MSEMNNKDCAVTNHTSFAYTSVDHMMITLNALDQRISDHSVMNSCSYYTGSENWYLGDLVTIQDLNKPSRDTGVQI